MKDPLANIKLGQAQAYIEHYEPDLLQAVPRALSRQAHAVAEFHGVDVWTAYELSWLTPGGKPQVAIAEFTVPAVSPNLIESKSFKYYLNSFNQTEVNSVTELEQILVRDLSRVAGAPVAVRLYDLDEFSGPHDISLMDGVVVNDMLLDRLPLQIDCYHPESALLQLGEGTFNGIWCSHLLKSNCPVTGQPDWASIWIGWQGRSLDPASVLRYIVSYRQHQDFHENCVERIYTDLRKAGQPEDLWVYARYTRRGGLDINPFRSMRLMSVPKVRAARQ